MGSCPEWGFVLVGGGGGLSLMVSYLVESCPGGGLA